MLRLLLTSALVACVGSRLATGAIGSRCADGARAAQTRRQLEKAQSVRPRRARDDGGHRARRPADLRLQARISVVPAPEFLHQEPADRRRREDRRRRASASGSALAGAGAVSRKTARRNRRREGPAEPARGKIRIGSTASTPDSKRRCATRWSRASSPPPISWISSSKRGNTRSSAATSTWARSDESRVLPDADVHRRARTAQPPAARAEQGNRPADEQGVARHAVGRSGGSPDREVRLQRTWTPTSSLRSG